MRDSTRRAFIKATGAAGVGSLLPFTGIASAANQSTATLDNDFDVSSNKQQKALVVHESNEAVTQLSTLSLSNGFHKFEVLPIGYTEATGSELKDIARLDSVKHVEKDKELDYYNDDARKLLRTNQVQSGSSDESTLKSPYTGATAGTALIDSGIDGTHPDLKHALEHNYKWIGSPLDQSLLWTDVGRKNTDPLGHGTHTSGTIGGDGTKSNGKFRGHAPDVDLTMYAAGLGLLLVKAVAAYDHILANHQTEIQIVSNSYGWSSPSDFKPDLPLNIATWAGYEAGLLSLFSAGNSGPAPNTLNDYAKAPNVLGIAATNDNKTVTDFSSRGRAPDYSGGGEGANYDRNEALANLNAYRNGDTPSGPMGLYRMGVGAPGKQIVSTMAPDAPLQGSNSDDRPSYATLSGTSMSCPATAGVATLVVDAYQQNTGNEPAPLDVLHILEQTAEEAHEKYTPYTMGAGFPDGYDAVERAENGDLFSQAPGDLRPAGARSIGPVDS